MCSEELRLDLESFINKGLSKGLRGWPVKEEERPAAENGSQRYGQLAMLGFACHLREGPAACRFEPNPPRRIASPQLYVGGYLTPRMNLGAFGFVRAQG